MGQISLTKEIKQKVYQQLKDLKIIDYVVGYGRFMDILSSIWDVYSIPRKEDYRYVHYGDEVQQHFINNNDWNTDRIFVSDLKIYDDDAKFEQFVIGILNECGNAELSIQNAINELLAYLHEQKLDISTVEENGKRIFLEFITLSEAYSDIKENDIPIFVVKARGHTQYGSFQTSPSVFPSVQLVYDDGWNDYGYYTRFVMYYYRAQGDYAFIGDVRILKGENSDTFDAIEKTFTTLGQDSCSLGFDKDYYVNMHNCLGEQKWPILKAMRDVACYPLLRSQFENNEIYYTSLLRDEGRDMLEYGIYYAMGRSLQDSFSFQYRFKPEYSEQRYPITFDFTPGRKNDYLKIYGIIGENGVGKTTFLRKLPKALSRRNQEDFEGQLPLYSKIIAVSFSPFDIFADLKPSPWFNYVYCGLMDEVGKVKDVTEVRKTLIEQFVRINEQSLGNDWKEAMEEVMDNEELNLLSEVDGDMKVLLKDDFTVDTLMSFSSGQRNMLLSMSSIISNIGPHSLLLIDEPEQHMHPNGITAIMRSLFFLVRKFNSYAIITTHSPLVIRELVGDRVYVMRRSGKILNVSKIPIESFGEDVSVLIDRIFDNYGEQKKFVSFINQWAKESNATIETIAEKIENNGLALSLNAKLYIREALIKNRERNEEA